MSILKELEVSLSKLDKKIKLEVIKEFQFGIGEIEELGSRYIFDKCIKHFEKGKFYVDGYSHRIKPDFDIICKHKNLFVAVGIFQCTLNLTIDNRPKNPHFEGAMFFENYTNVYSYDEAQIKEEMYPYFIPAPFEIELGDISEDLTLLLEARTLLNNEIKRMARNENNANKVSHSDTKTNKTNKYESLPVERA